MIYLPKCHKRRLPPRHHVHVHVGDGDHDHVEVGIVVVVVIIVVIIVVVIVVVCVDHVGCQGGREDGEAHEVEHVEAVAGAGAAPVAASYIAGHAS